MLGIKGANHVSHNLTILRVKHGAYCCIHTRGKHLCNKLINTHLLTSTSLWFHSPPRKSIGSVWTLAQSLLGPRGNWIRENNEMPNIHFPNTSSSSSSSSSPSSSRSSPSSSQPFTFNHGVPGSGAARPWPCPGCPGATPPAGSLLLHGFDDAANSLHSAWPMALWRSSVFNGVS